MRNLSSLVLILVLSAGLMGCRTIWDPTFMPAGYTYHDDEYKAPIGPEADDLGYEYSAEKNEEILQVWRMAAADLVDQLEDQTGLAPQGIYVHKRADHNAFNASYDHVLREELSARGYTLSTSAAEAPLALWYEAHIPVDAEEDETPVYNGDETDDYEAMPVHQEFVLILTLVRENALFGKAAGVYQLPAYGYETDDGIELPVLAEPIAGGQAP